MTVPRLLLALLAGLLGLAFGALAAYLGEAALARRRVMVACPYCTAPYSTMQWSALVAVLTGHGRCAACGHLLRAPRLFGELFLALTWGLLIASYGVTPRTLLAMVALFPQAIIIVTDLEAKLIPNRIMLPSIAGMLVIGTLFGPAVPPMGFWHGWSTLAGAAIGFATFRFLVWLGVALFGEGALGEGDITLAAYVGAVVGFPLIIQSLLLAFAFGGIGAALVLIFRRGQLGTAIPYGPFIILGCVTTLLFGAELLQWFMT
jgi:leader peptidase (prepilin peptidase) / N-methyltransferase